MKLCITNRIFSFSRKWSYPYALYFRSVDFIEIVSHRPIFSFSRKCYNIIDMYYTLEVWISSKLCVSKTDFSVTRENTLIDLYYIAKLSISSKLCITPIFQFFEKLCSYQYVSYLWSVDFIEMMSHKPIFQFLRKMLLLICIIPLKCRFHQNYVLQTDFSVSRENTLLIYIISLNSWFHRNCA